MSNTHWKRSVIVVVVLLLSSVAHFHFPVGFFSVAFKPIYKNANGASKPSRLHYKARRKEGMGCKCTKLLSRTKVNAAEISVEPPIRIESKNLVNQHNSHGQRPASERAARSTSGVAVNVEHQQHDVPSTHVIDSVSSEESPKSDRSTSPSDSSSTDTGKEMSDRMHFVVHRCHFYRQTRPR